MDEVDEPRQRVHLIVHELANVLGIARNYADFLAADLAEAEVSESIRAQARSIGGATERAVDLLARLRETIALSEQEVGADGAQQRQDE
jgi:phage shock protein A